MVKSDALQNGTGDRISLDHDVEEANEKQKMLQDPERRRSDPGVKPTPQLNASLFSKYISFWWLNSLVSLGSKRPLEASDLYGLMPQDTTEVVGEKLQREWDKEVKKSKKKNKRPNLIWALLCAFGGQYALLGLLTLFADALRLAQPILIGQLVSYFAEESTMSTRDAFLYAMGVSLSAIIINLLNTPFTFMCQVFGMRVRAACTALVYNKAIKLSNAGLASVTTGHVINLVSVDAQKFDYTSMWLHYLLLGPIETVVVTYLLWLQIGPACFAGMGLVILLAPFQVQMGNVLLMLRFKALDMVDERMKVMNEVISGMKVIKMYTWESSFAKWITNIRDKELKWFLRLQLVMGSFMAFFFSASAIISFVTFLTYVLTGNVLVAQKVFTCVALFANIKMVMALKFPLAISLLNDCKVSWKRMEDLMLQEEARSENLITSKLRPKLENCEIVADHVTAVWNKEMTSPTLDDLSFTVKPGELLGVIGPVGSGKSSLLMSIVGELPVSKGTITVKGKIGYASQQAWVFNGSLRQNVLFGQQYEKKRYEEVLKVCALDKDIELLQDGDMTLVGERGVSLSGGQRARVNLARAVYFNADIYLMDDPLSAVDAHVGRHLFDKCISQYLSDKPRILVTHQLQFLKEADQLLVLSEGKCVGLDTFKELSKKNIGFISQLIQEEMEADSPTENEADGDVETGHRSRQYIRQESKGPKSAALSRSSLRLYGSTISVSAVTSGEKAIDDDILPEEEKQTGAVTLKTWRQYLKTLHSYGAAFAVFVLFILSQTLVLLADWWLSFWSNAEEHYHYSKLAHNATITNVTYSAPDFDRDQYLMIYGGLVIAVLVVAVIGCESFFALMVVSSRRLHLGMFKGIIRAPQYFFDTNSIGRILNRFSKDLTLIDDLLPVIMCDFIQMGLVCIGILCLVAATNPITLIIAVPVLILFILFRNYYMKTCREVKRVEGICRSPLFGHFSTTLLGLDTIRAYGMEETLSHQLNSYQDAHSRCWYTFLAGRGALNFRLETLCDIFIVFVSLVAPALKGTVDLSAGSVGLMLSYSVLLTQVFQPFIEESAEVENLMTSVERILEYCDLESEAAPETDVKPPPNWPSNGNIVFDNMSLAYHKSLPNVLHNISCNIKPKEKVGVVGRTGAGKSSLLTTLFRMAEPSGLIEIDGVNISKLGLKDLRSKLSIIPQEPVIFSDTMRKNLDPFDEYTDTDIWQVLEEVQLKPAVMDLPLKLQEELAESGSNFSVGQRQLICLARAILKQSRILVIDEATANVDPQTDALIQRTIREKFKDCTVMTIAHRLHTIMDSDRVMVLDSGRLKEFDIPYTLLKNSTSIFYQLVQSTGQVEAKRLLQIAKETYENKKEPIPPIKEEDDLPHASADHHTMQAAHENSSQEELDAAQVSLKESSSVAELNKAPTAPNEKSNDEVSPKETSNDEDNLPTALNENPSDGGEAETPDVSFKETTNGDDKEDVALLNAVA